ncbi:MAG: hypothetical protein M1821_007863 [Bathelium mastoideum]|nr:MAG: hypothetical protein M1821_007863 [Bathelium mastoideum]KAI9692912.1 MAG: hypothetical protein M1822_004906 [Bathelium mastoideum]
MLATFFILSYTGLALAAPQLQPRHPTTANDALSSAKPLIPSLTGIVNTKVTVVPTPTAISPDGSCGGNTGYTCAGSTSGQCCSIYGTCGNTNAYCGANCDARSGKCGAPFGTGHRPHHSANSTRKTTTVMITQTHTHTHTHSQTFPLFSTAAALTTAVVPLPSIQPGGPLIPVNNATNATTLVTLTVPLFRPTHGGSSVTTLTVTEKAGTTGTGVPPPPVPPRAGSGQGGSGEGQALAGYWRGLVSWLERYVVGGAAVLEEGRRGT